jgi:two-component system, LytTR family, sensor kinase
MVGKKEPQIKQTRRIVMEKPYTWGKKAAAPLVWLTLALLSTTQLYSIFRFENRQIPLWRIACWQASTWLLWALLTPFVLQLGRRYRFERASWRRAALIHLAVSVAFALLQMVFLAFVRHTAPLLPEAPQSLRDALLSCVSYFHINLLTYWATLGVGGAFDFYRRWQTERLQGAELKAQLARARLQALQMQLHPHFLFNTLHTIGTMVEDEPKLARRMITRLGDFLRLTLEEDVVEMVSLGREVEFARAYLSIEELRFQDRLQSSYSFAPETTAASVPYLILQPLIENAIRHGIAPRAGPGRVELRAERHDGRLRIEVRDDGGKIASTHDGDNGLGLANTRARLEQIYGPAGLLTLTVDGNGDTVAAVEIPFVTRL